MPSVPRIKPRAVDGFAKNPTGDREAQAGDVKRRDRLDGHADGQERRSPDQGDGGERGHGQRALVHWARCRAALLECHARNIPFGGSFK